MLPTGAWAFFLPFLGDSLDEEDEEDDEEEEEEDEEEEDAEEAEVEEGGNLKGRWPMLTTTASPSSNDSAGYNPAATLP